MTQQAVGWALHALEPDEEMAVLLHMPQCATCRAAVREAEQALAGLGGAVEQVDPPARLRDRLMAGVADTPQRPPVLRPWSAEPVETPRAEPARRPEPDAEEPTPARRRSFLGGRGRKLVAASVAAVAVASLGGLIVTSTQLQQQRDAETAQAQSLSELLTELDRPGSRHALLVDADTGATVAALLVSGTDRQLYTLGLPANPGDQVYVAWGLKGEGVAPVPLGVFDVAAADRGVRTVGSEAEADDYSGYAISIEPGRVAPASPSRVVASGQVAI